MGKSTQPARHLPAKRDMNYMKPEGFEEYLTITEVGRLLGRDTRYLRRLEEANRIPRAHRVKVGELSVRLWSPRHVEEIQEVLSKMRRGRPRGS